MVENRLHYLQTKNDASSCPLLHEDTLVHDNQRKAEIFIEYFSKISHVDGLDDPIPETSIPRSENEITSIQTDAAKVKQILKDLRIGSAKQDLMESQTCL